MKLKKLLVFALLCCLPLMLGLSEDNLMPYTDFETDANGNLTGWELTGSGDFNVRDDEEKGRVLQVELAESGAASFQQRMPVNPATAYCIRFDARVLNFSGYDGAYVEIPGVADAFSEKAITDQWQTIELYGYIAEWQDELLVSFSFGSYTQGDTGTAEFANIEFFVPTHVPMTADEGKYVFFYDTSTQTDQETAPNVSSSPAFVLGLLFVALILVLNSYGVFDPQPAKALQGEKAYARKALVVIIAAATLFRMLFAYTTFGHQTDINDFAIWAQNLNEVGIGRFYTDGVWCDYPPGYMYILYIVGWLANALGLGMGSQGLILLLKLPAIICDAVAIWLVFRIARKRLGDNIALVLAGLYALNPMVIYDSAFWGQIDSVFLLAVLGVLWFYYTDKKELGAVAFIAGVLIKPQMLILGPVVLFAYIKDIIQGDTKRELLVLGRSALAMIAAAAVIILPFWGGKTDPLWLPKLLSETTTQYKYATINAYNFWALLGANWRPYETAGLLGISYYTLGNIAILVTSALSGYLVFRNKEKKAVFPAALFMLWGIFTFAHSMHERYLFPVMLLALLCYILYRDRRYVYLFAISTFVLFTNSVVALNDLHIQGFDMRVMSIAFVEVLGFVYAAYVCFTPSNIPQEQTADKPSKPKGREEATQIFITPGSRPNKAKPLDYIAMLLITGVYAIVSLTNLGSTKVPESYWRTQADGETAVVEFAQELTLNTVYFYPGICKGTMTISLGNDTDEQPPSYGIVIDEGQMYKWQTEPIPGRATRLTITMEKANMMINEMAFFDMDGNMAEIASITPVGDGGGMGAYAALVDEQPLVDTAPTYMTEMYFDELYHARTAFEHLSGWLPFENTHPPLGKVFIMLGIWIFGMNPFGWRIVGALFGIAMLPLMYVFALRIFKKTRYAAAATLLFALDGMHFVQTRIATIDVYGVFFIMAMCYFMYRYWQMNFFVDDFKQTLKPLGLSGVMFGFGIASKWIGFYAGGGLAVALFTSFGLRYVEYRRAKRLLAAGHKQDAALLQTMVDTFRQKVLHTCLFCVGFFVAIPVAIYILSYLPYYLCAEHHYTLGEVWDIQTYMFNFHSALTASHPYESIWWEWPIIARPIWYYYGTSAPEGMIASIAAFGNPAVWWAGLASALGCCGMMITRDPKLDRHSTAAILIFLAAALLPWIFITRATFIYHYFASVPFIILLTVMCMQRAEAGRFAKPARWAGYGLLAVAAGLFVLFYPVWSGMNIDREFTLTFLKWFQRWEFFG